MFPIHAMSSHWISPGNGAYGRLLCQKELKKAFRAYYCTGCKQTIYMQQEIESQLASLISALDKYPSTKKKVFARKDTEEYRVFVKSCIKNRNYLCAKCIGFWPEVILMVYYCLISKYINHEISTEIKDEF